MTQNERRTFLIKKLLGEQPRYKDLQIPKDAVEQKHLLRSLMNIRAPKNIDNDFFAGQV